MKDDDTIEEPELLLGTSIVVLLSLPTFPGDIGHGNADLRLCPDNGVQLPPLPPSSLPQEHRDLYSEEGSGGGDEAEQCGERERVHHQRATLLLVVVAVVAERGGVSAPVVVVAVL